MPYKVIRNDASVQKNCIKCKHAKGTNLLEQGRFSDFRIHKHKGQWIRQRLFGPYCRPCADILKKEENNEVLV